jgi:hypothetical protein
MRAVFTICFLALSMSLSASKLIWHKGSVVLADHDEVITGEISLESTHDLILFRTSESVTVYPAHKLKSFQYYDAETNINRKFVSLKDNHGVVRSHHLYEYVLRGAFSVLRKVKGGLIKGGGPYSEQNDFDYYVFHKNELVSLSKFRTHIYPQMLNLNRDEILSYVHHNNLDLNLPANAIIVIKYFNTEAGYGALAANY